jgi:AbrB family looped-hinge helix DNA binding protein
MHASQNRRPGVAALSRIGQRRQVVIPKSIFNELGLEEGDFMEITAEPGRVFMKPKKPIDADEVLTPADKRKIKRGEAQIKRGQARPWHAVKRDLGH